MTWPTTWTGGPTRGTRCSQSSPPPVAASRSSPPHAHRRRRVGRAAARRPRPHRRVARPGPCRSEGTAHGRRDRGGVRQRHGDHRHRPSVLAGLGHPAAAVPDSTRPDVDPRSPCGRARSSAAARPTARPAAPTTMTSLSATSSSSALASPGSPTRSRSASRGSSREVRRSAPARRTARDRQADPGIRHARERHARRRDVRDLRSHGRSAQQRHHPGSSL